MSAHAGYERYESTQRGSQSFALPDWQAVNEDTTLFVGLRINLPQWFERVDLQLGYTFSQSTGEIQTSTTGRQDVFPNLETRLHRVEFNVDYPWRDNLTLRLGWVYEDYQVDDWALDDVDVDTVPGVLGLGNTWLDHDIYRVALSLNYSPEKAP